MYTEYKAKTKQAANKLTKAQAEVLIMLAAPGARLSMKRYSNGSNGWAMGVITANRRTVCSLKARELIKVKEKINGAEATLSVFGRDVISEYLMG